MTPRRSALLCFRQTASGGSSPTPSVRQSLAYAVRLAMPKFSFSFCHAANAVILGCRTTLRGRPTCKNPLSPLPFCPSWPLRAACRTRSRAARQGPLLVQPWLTSPTATLPPAPSSVALPARQAALFRGNAPATDAKLTAAPKGARSSTSSGPSGPTAQVVFCFCADKTAFRPGRGTRGERCSTRF